MYMYDAQNCHIPLFSDTIGSPIISKGSEEDPNKLYGIHRG